MTNIAIEAMHVSKNFGSNKALDDLSFTLPESSITGFIGPNGAGKTTTLRILTTLVKPDQGTISIFGQDMNQSDGPMRRQIGFMPDYFGLYEDMNVEEYLDFFAATYRIAANKRRTLVADILELLELTSKKSALVGSLSRGMQQRLSLGRALVHDPKLLLLDEPASGLDPRARIELMSLLRELRAMGKTIFISSHILAELKDICDWVVIIEHGRLVYQGTIQDAAISHDNQKTLLVTLTSGAEQAMALLQQSELVDSVTNEDHCKLTINYQSHKISSPEIIRLLVENKFALEEAVKHKTNLEDFFLSVTKGGEA